MIIPRYYQEDALSAIYNYFMTNKGNPLIGLPTGTGKSLLPALFIERTIKHWPEQKFLLITHVKELISQNSEVMLEVWPQAPLGIFSAGLKRKELGLPIIFGGIQSMIRDPARFGHRDIIWIDEAHLVNQDEASQYQTFLAVMKLINPNVKLIGLTATLYRMGQGQLIDNGLFTDVCYDLTSMDGFNRLIAEGYLCPLVPLRTKTELDVSNVSIIKGEFVASQLQSAVDVQEVTFNGLRELVEAGHNRRSWLIFASGIEHAEHIASMLGIFRIDCIAVHSKNSSEFNDKAIKAFKNFELRSIVNYGKLTTGFNHPAIDLIGMFRPTLSVPLWVQMLGRGTRPYENKNNCLVLDFARNTPRLGPINDPAIPRKKGEGTGEIPVKICESCGAYNHIKVKFCANCGDEFSFEIKITSKSGNHALLAGELPIIETYNVDRAIYGRAQKDGKPAYINVTYFCGMQAFKERIFPEHGRYATHLFHNWWRQRHVSIPPSTTDEALQYISQLRAPKKIRVHVNRKYPEILGCEF